MANLAALRAAVFRSLRKTWGGRIPAPPGRARVIDQKVPYGLRNTIRCLSAHYEPFWGGQNSKKSFSLKWSFFFSLFYDPKDPISTHMNDKRTPNPKSAHQTTPGGTKPRKMTYDVIKGHWPLMTSVDLGKVTMLVQTMDVTSQHPSMPISPAKIPKFASFRHWNGTERKFRLTWPWKSGHRHGWRNRGGGDREEPSPPGPINSISWVGPGGGPNL